MTNKICITAINSYGYFNSEYPPGGGAERQMYLLSQQWKDQFEVCFVVADHGQPTIEVRDGVTLYKAYKTSLSTSIFTEISKFRHLFRSMVEADADVYVHRGNPKRAAVVFLISKILGKKFIYHIANNSNLTSEYDQLQQPIKKIFRITLQKGDCVIAQTSQQSDILAERFSAESRIIPNGYPATNQYLQFEDRNKVLWIGRLDKKQKRPHLFLNIVDSLPGCQFCMIALPGTDVSYNHKIRTRAKSLDNLSYIENVPPDKVHQHYKSAIVCVNTSAYEGFPNTFLESWRYGTPVAGLSIDPGKYLDRKGLGYCSGNITILQDMINKITSSQKYWEYISKYSIDYFERNYTLARTANKYIELLNCLV